MADISMAFNTIDGLLLIITVRGEFTDQRRVTAETVFLENRRVVWFDLNRLMEILQSKALGMPEAILHF